MKPERHCERHPKLTCFSTSYGAFVGRWRGEQLVPLGRTVDVEFDFDDCPWVHLAVGSE